ncbi:hypothetical protein ACLQ26_09615 [Micromonospora sp. DT43]|uniref:hypothetical protein n=1 Tax=Micromonospora sp. DT43 TaxID=3393440 RepID=UPI003CEAD1BC
MTRPRTRAVSILVVLAALAGLSACSPADKPVLAVRAVDGQPVLLLAECAVFTADRISVYTIDVTPAASWTVDRDGGAAVAGVTVFELPSGWTIDEQTLVAFDSATEYSAAAYGTERNAVPVHFTLGELTGLAPGEVLVGEAAGKRKAVTEAAFRKRAKKVC